MLESTLVVQAFTKAATTVACMALMCAWAAPLSAWQSYSITTTPPHEQSTRPVDWSFADSQNNGSISNQPTRVAVGNQPLFPLKQQTADQNSTENWQDGNQYNVQSTVQNNRFGRPGFQAQDSSNRRFFQDGRSGGLLDELNNPRRPGSGSGASRSRPPEPTCKWTNARRQ